MTGQVSTRGLGFLKILFLTVYVEFSHKIKKSMPEKAFETGTGIYIPLFEMSLQLQLPLRIVRPGNCTIEFICLQTQ